MVKSLYHTTNSHKGNSIEFDVTLDQKSGELLLNMKGTKGQFINFFMYNKISLNLDHAIVGYEMKSGDENIVINTKAPPTAGFHFSYIYSMTSKSDAIGYGKVVPPTYSSASGVVFNISKNTAYGLYSTYYAGVWRIYNSNKDPVKISSIAYTMTPGEMYENSSQYYCRKIADETLRVDDGSYTNMCYRDLSDDERSTLIPKTIITSGNPTIHWGTNTDWIPATQSQFKATLVYRETRDKEFHFTDENTLQKYKYNIDCVRSILPKLVNGKISGTFIYKGAGNRNIRYVPTLMNASSGGDSNGLIICESDDSDYDNED